MQNEPDVNTYSAARALIRQHRAWTSGLVMALLLFFLWLAWRTGWPEFALAGPFVAWAFYFAMRVAVDIVALVADTLMPR